MSYNTFLRYFPFFSFLICYASLFRFIISSKKLEEAEAEELPDNSITIQKIRYEYEENKRFLIFFIITFIIAFILSLLNYGNIIST